MSLTWPAGLRKAGTARAAKIRSSAKCRHYRSSKIQAMRSALRTTHQPSSPQWGEVYVRLRPVVPRPGAITGGYSCKIFPPSGKRKRGKNALYIYRAPENGKRKFWGERPAAEVGFPVWISRCLQTVNRCLFPGLISGQGGSVRIPIGDRESHQYRIHRNLGTWISLRGLGVPRLGGRPIPLWGSKKPRMVQKLEWIEMAELAVSWILFKSFCRVAGGHCWPPGL